MATRSIWQMLDTSSTYHDSLQRSLTSNQPADSPKKEKNRIHREPENRWRTAAASVNFMYLYGTHPKTGTKPGGLPEKANGEIEASGGEIWTSPPTQGSGGRTLQKAKKDSRASDGPKDVETLDGA
jgi:hypothetical protein